MDENDKVFADARQAGIDLDLIDTILSLSVAERWRQHDAAANLALKLEQARKTHDAGSEHASETSR
jgi:hypothetical protein